VRDDNRKNDPAAQRQNRETRSKRKVFQRTVILMLAFGVGLFIPLIRQIWNIAVVDHEYYQQLAVEQQTLDMSISSERGNIYDSNGNVMAMSATVYDLILSPRDLVNSINKKKFTDDGVLDEAAYQKAIDDKRELIADKICALLDVDRESVEKRMLRTDSAYEVIQKSIEGDLADEL